MTSPINFQDPIEALFKHIDDGVRYANAGIQSYMEAQYVKIALARLKPPKTISWGATVGVANSSDEVGTLIKLS
jgi:hypothetical protein